MDKSNEPIHPCIMQQVGENEFRLRRDGDPKEWQRPMVGLTKREHFAAIALQGLLSGSHEDNTTLKTIFETLDMPLDSEYKYPMHYATYLSKISVSIADALINALNQPLK